MMVITKVKLACMSAVVLSGLAGVARADTVNLLATQSLSYDGNVPVVLTQTATDGGSASVSDSIGSANSSVNGRDLANEAIGFLGLGTASQGIGIYASSGLAGFNDVFLAPGTGHFNFNFEFVGGFISTTADKTTTGGTQVSSFGAKVTERIDGGPEKTLFDYLGLMTLVGNGTPTFTQTGALLPSGGPSLTQGSGLFQFLLYSHSVDLGALRGGQSVEINYTLTSFASGTGTTCGGTAISRFAKPAIVSGPGDTLGCATAFASNLDPSATTLPPTITPVAPVPEPASMAILLGGGLAFGAVRRARRPG